MPLMAHYLDDLEARLQALGVPGGLYVMLSSGGIATPATEELVRLIEARQVASAA